MTQTRENMIAEIRQRVKDKVLEKSNAELLIKLINNADNDDEAGRIESLGTTYKRTGLHFDKRLDKPDNTIHYFKKNNELSFADGKSEITHKLIIGDNIYALQNLLIQYRNKIDVIYIDPPYSKNSMGEHADTNYENALSRDNLLSMLYTRLILAKQLLSENGLIFCSIDDRNQAYLKCLFDEVFYEKNFICNFMWKKTDTPPSLSNKVRKKLEYVLCYSKRYNSKRIFAQGYIDGGDAPLLNNSNSLNCLEFPVGTIHFNIPDGIYKTNDSHSIKLLEPVVVQDGVNKNIVKAEGHFKWGQDNLIEEISEGTFFLVKSKKFSIRYQKEGLTTKKPSNIIDNDVNVGTNETADAELQKLGFLGDFDYAKPVSLITYLIKMGFWSDDKLNVLDFFAGSGTTGHAVLELNKDNHNHTFILCQSNEKTERNPNGIANDVTTKRLKRIMTGSCYDGSSDFKWIKENKAYGGNLDVYDIASIPNNAASEGQTAFDLIDETLYGIEKMNSKNKIAWVCENFSATQSHPENDEEWKESVEKLVKD